MHVVHEIHTNQDNEPKARKNDAKPTLMHPACMKDKRMKPKTNLGDETNVRA